MNMNPGFVRIPRTNGSPALVRVDSITAILAGKTKDGPELSVQLGPVVTLHTRLTEGELLSRMRAASGISFALVPTEPDEEKSEEVAAA